MAIASLTQVQLINGFTYECGKPWPGVKVREDKDPNTPPDPIERVGVIFFRPEIAEGVAVDEGEDTEGLTAAETHPAHYEIWRVTDEIFEGFFGLSKLDKEVLFKKLIESKVGRRLVYMHQILGVEEVIPAMDGFEIIKERLQELDAQRLQELSTEEDTKPDNGAQVAPPSGV